MVLVHGQYQCEVLGAIALTTAAAATAMGLYNRAQLLKLKKDLFEVKENIGHLFEVVQDFSKGITALETGFNKLWTTLFYQVMFNPTLFDTHLSRLKNQLQGCLCWVNHAIQAAMHQRLAVD
jgi:hypothetical protein